MVYCWSVPKHPGAKTEGAKPVVPKQPVPKKSHTLL